MRINFHNQTKPSFNLACEQYFFETAQEDIFMLWRNERSVIVGRNQNTFAEVNRDYANENGIAVVRRMTGGGAVFHDLGNINYTYITTYNGPVDFKRFSEPMITALNAMGFPVYLSGRNDLLCEEKKISGAAQTIKNGRVLHHGTLLYSADMSSLAKVLNVNSDKYAGRSVKSVVSRVANLAGFCENPPAVEVFAEMLYNALAEQLPDAERYSLSDADIIGAEAIVAGRYALDEWNFGQRHHYNFQNSIRTNAGGITAELYIKDGVIRNAAFHGDYFSTCPGSAEAAVTGIPHTPESISRALPDNLLGEAFVGFSPDEIRNLLF